MAASSKAAADESRTAQAKTTRSTSRAGGVEASTEANVCRRRETH